MTLMLVDGNNLAMRSYHAAKHSMTHNGEVTGGLHLFVQTLARHVAEERPERLMVFWDTDGSAWRRRIYPAYKAARSHPVNSVEPHEEMFVLVKRFLALAGILECGRSGQEADDLIAAVWRANRHTDPIVILSADKDLMQLLDGNTTQVKFIPGGQTERWTRDRFIAERGYTPEQLPLMMALMGDPGDGVPGIRGVGPKKAQKMLTAASWDLEKAVASQPEHWGIVRTSLALVDLRNPSPNAPSAPQVPLWYPTGHGDTLWAALLAFLDEWAMQSIRSRLERSMLWRPDLTVPGLAQAMDRS